MSAEYWRFSVCGWETDAVGFSWRWADVTATVQPRCVALEWSTNFQSVFFSSLRWNHYRLCGQQQFGSETPQPSILRRHFCRAERHCDALLQPGDLLLASTGIHQTFKIGPVAGVFHIINALSHRSKAFWNKQLAQALCLALHWLIEFSRLLCVYM